MMTNTQIEQAPTGELEELTARIEAELTRRQLSDRGEGERREVVSERPAPAGTYRQEYVSCGKSRCKKCAGGPGHGPYWYHYYRRGGKLASRYIGKELPEGAADA